MQVREAQIPSKLKSGTISSLVQLLVFAMKEHCVSGIKQSIMLREGVKKRKEGKGRRGRKDLPTSPRWTVDRGAPKQETGA